MVVWRTQGSKTGGNVQFFAEHVEGSTDNKAARCLAIVADAHWRFACNGDQS
jgi:hypothetical protein